MKNTTKNNNSKNSTPEIEKAQAQEQVEADETHKYSFSLDNSLEETYIKNINLEKEEEKKEKISDKEKQDIKREAEDLKELFLLS
jgi:hypothetical protein